MDVRKLNVQCTITVVTRQKLKKTRRICELVFYLFLPPSRRDGIPSILVCDEPITTVYLIWSWFDTFLYIVYGLIRRSVSHCWCFSLTTGDFQPNESVYGQEIAC